MKTKIFLFLALIFSITGFSQTRLSLGRIDTIWQAGKVPIGNNNTNTWYSLYGGSGTGTTNFVAKWTNSLTIGNSQFQDNGTTTSLGTSTTPYAALNIDKTITQTLGYGAIKANATYNINNGNGSNLYIGNTLNLTENLGALGNADELIGLSVNGIRSGSGSIGSMRVIGAQAIFNTSATDFLYTMDLLAPSYTGIPGVSFGLHIANHGKIGIINTYGLFIENQTGSSTNYGIISSSEFNGFGTVSPTGILHTVAFGAKVNDYSGNILTNTATSSTASKIKSGVEITSTGTWNGGGASNIGLYISSVTGGTNNYDAIFNGGGNVGIGTNTANQKLQVVGSIGIDATKTTYTASVSGDVTFSEPLSGSSYKKIVIYINAATGTASYTYPTSFTNTPGIVITSTVAAAVVTSLSTTAVTVTGAATTGFIFLEGY